MADNLTDGLPNSSWKYEGDAYDGKIKILKDSEQPGVSSKYRVKVKAQLGNEVIGEKTIEVTVKSENDESDSEQCISPKEQPRTFSVMVEGSFCEKHLFGKLTFHVDDLMAEELKSDDGKKSLCFVENNACTLRDEEAGYYEFSRFSILCDKNSDEWIIILTHEGDDKSYKIFASAKSPYACGSEQGGYANIKSMEDKTFTFSEKDVKWIKGGCNEDSSSSIDDDDNDDEDDGNVDCDAIEIIGPFLARKGLKENPTHSPITLFNTGKKSGMTFECDYLYDNKNKFSAWIEDFLSADEASNDGTPITTGMLRVRWESKGDPIELEDGVLLPTTDFNYIDVTIMCDDGVLEIYPDDESFYYKKLIYENGHVHYSNPIYFSKDDFYVTILSTDCVCGSLPSVVPPERSDSDSDLGESGICMAFDDMPSSVTVDVKGNFCDESLKGSITFETKQEDNDSTVYSKKNVVLQNENGEGQVTFVEARLVNKKASNQKWTLYLSYSDGTNTGRVSSDVWYSDSCNSDKGYTDPSSLENYIFSFKRDDFEWDEGCDCPETPDEPVEKSCRKFRYLPKTVTVKAKGTLCGNKISGNITFPNKPEESGKDAIYKAIDVTLDDKTNGSKVKFDGAELSSSPASNEWKLTLKYSNHASNVDDLNSGKITATVEIGEACEDPYFVDPSLLEGSTFTFSEEDVNWTHGSCKDRSDSDDAAPCIQYEDLPETVTAHVNGEICPDIRLNDTLTFTESRTQTGADGTRLIYVLTNALIKTEDNNILTFETVSLFTDYRSNSWSLSLHYDDGTNVGSVVSQVFFSDGCEGAEFGFPDPRQLDAHEFSFSKKDFEWTKGGLCPETPNDDSNSKTPEEDPYSPEDNDDFCVTRKEVFRDALIAVHGTFCGQDAKFMVYFPSNYRNVDTTKMGGGNIKYQINERSYVYEDYYYVGNSSKDYFAKNPSSLDTFWKSQAERAQLQRRGEKRENRKKAPTFPLRGAGDLARWMATGAELEVDASTGKLNLRLDVYDAELDMDFTGVSTKFFAPTCMLPTDGEVSYINPKYYAADHMTFEIGEFKPEDKDFKCPGSSDKSDSAPNDDNSTSNGSNEEGGESGNGSGNNEEPLKANQVRLTAGKYSEILNSDDNGNSYSNMPVRCYEDDVKAGTADWSVLQECWDWHTWQLASDKGFGIHYTQYSGNTLSVSEPLESGKDSPVMDSDDLSVRFAGRDSSGNLYFDVASATKQSGNTYVDKNGSTLSYTHHGHNRVSDNPYDDEGFTEDLGPIFVKIEFPS